MDSIAHLFGIELPIVQAPMAGVQRSALAIAVSNAGGLGSLPCALLSLDDMRRELSTITKETTKPFNVNFFCHRTPTFDAARDARWKATLLPYYRALGLDPQTIRAVPARAAFSAEMVDVLSEFRPSVVSFHFGLPSAELLARVKAF